MAQDPVAIVGMAGIFPGAPDLGAFWANLVAGVDAIRPVPPDRVDPVFFEPGRSGPDRFYCDRGGFIDSQVPFDPSEFGIMPVAAAGTEPDQLLALATAARALADAGYVEGVPDPSRVGIVIGRGGYLTPATARLEQRVRTAHQLVACLRELVPDLAADRLDAIRQQFQQALGPSHPEASIGLVPNLVASLVANRLDLQGGAYTVDAACASSLLAVDHAVTELISGRADMVLAGGVHHCHDVTLWSVFSQLRALSPTGTIRPFDRRADGILIGEGTGIVVLKRLSDAERADDRIYGVIRGVGVSSDGRAATLMSPAVKGQALAIERAWASAGLDPATVGLIEAHGAGTHAGDTTEIATLRRVFEADGSATAPPVGLGSVKSNIGHAMPASGIAGLIKTALALHHGIVPPTLHCEDPHPDLEPSRFEVVTEARTWPEDGRPRRAGVDAFGFGGINAHVIVDGHASSPGTGTVSAHGGAGALTVPGTPAARWHRAGRRRPAPAEPAAEPTRLFVCSAADTDELAARLADGDAVLAGSDLAAVAAESGGPVRLAVADPTPKRLELARKVVARGTPWRGRNDLWFSAEGLVAAGGKVAYAFPGIEPTAVPDVSDVADHFGLAVDRIDRETAVERQGGAMVTTGRVLAAALAELGVEPDVVAGHSMGEWTAMLVAGTVTQEAIDFFVTGIADGDLVLPDLLFLALGCGVETAEAAIAGLPDIVVSHDNCPHQVIVCGSEESVGVAQQRLRSQRVLGQVLPFRTGFHTPMFERYIGPLDHALGDVPLYEPRVPVYSSVTARPFPADDESVRALGRRLLVERVRFRELVANMYDDGVRAVVQAGAGSVSGFVADTLHDRPHLVVSGADPKRSGMAQLARVAAALYVEGAEVRLDRLAAPPARPTTGRVPVPAPASGPDAGAMVATSATSGVGPAGNGAAKPPTVLRFEASLVRGGLDPLERPAAPAARAEAPPDELLAGRGPLADEFRATLRAVTDAGRDVLAALDTAPRLRPAPPQPAPTRGPGPASSPPPAGGPAGRPASTPGGWRETRHMSLAARPELIDHSFYPQPPEASTISDRFPVVPMTAIIALFVDTAARLAPDRVVVGLQNVRALRWLAVEPPVDVEITAAFDGPDRVKVAIDGFARAVVLLADGYPPPPPPDTAPLRDQRPPPHSARELYEQRWMFHGPAYQGVTEMHAMGSDGVRAAVTSLPAPGALLDAAGQLLGYWIEANTTEDRLALPMRIDRIDFHGPHPEPGASLDCLVRFTEVNEADARGNVDLVRDGVLWARMHQFIDRRFETAAQVFEVLRAPDTIGLAERRDGYWLLREPWGSSASRDLVVRRYLGGEERDEYFALTPKAQREWALGRLVIKDAVRQWLWDRGAGPIYPMEIRVRNEPSGRPTVTVPGGQAVNVSLSHRNMVAVASVSEGAAGIDVEVPEPRGERFAALALTDDEVALGAGRPHDEWVTRVWTVKEAAAKAAGTGLQGRPKDFVVRRLDGDWSLVGDRWVHTTREGELIVSTVRQR